MKWLTTLLALYLLSLSLWPCADGALPLMGQAGSAVVSVSTASESDTSHPEHEHDHDQCTPFCTCSCCGATVTVEPVFRFTILPHLTIVPETATVFAYEQLHWADLSLTIWQPPKLRV